MPDSTQAPEGTEDARDEKSPVWRTREGPKAGPLREREYHNEACFRRALASGYVREWEVREA